MNKRERLASAGRSARIATLGCGAGASGGSVRRKR